jgi:YD repeat-containing protein
MRSHGFGALLAVIVVNSIAFGQTLTSPNLETGFKPYGSYDSVPFESINLMNGNPMLHISYPQDYVQRGGKVVNNEFLMMQGKSWATQLPTPNAVVLDWEPARAMIGPVDTLHPEATRALTVAISEGVTSQSVGQDALVTWDGSTHPLMDVSGGKQNAFQAVDGSGWHVNMSNPNTYGVNESAVIIDRNGTQYTATEPAAGCKIGVGVGSIGRVGGWAPIQNQETDNGAGSSCTNGSFVTAATDANGNIFSMPDNNPWTDTMGRTAPSGFAGGALYTAAPPSPGCPASSLTYYGYVTSTYPAANGGTNQIILCYGTLSLQTNFGISGVDEYPGPGGSTPAALLTSIVLPDGRTWTFTYDSYGNLTYIGLPLGGSISYQWATVAFPPVGVGAPPASRAVVQRTLTDNNGNSFVWKYQWMLQPVTQQRHNHGVHQRGHGPAGQRYAARLYLSRGRLL